MGSECQLTGGDKQFSIWHSCLNILGLFQEQATYLELFTELLDGSEKKYPTWGYTLFIFLPCYDLR